MGLEKQHELRIAQLNFIGKVLSVFTHELNNHLAIIKESAGLLEDIMKFQKAQDKESLAESLKTIYAVEAQVSKSAWLIKNLNSFGHRMDKPVTSFSINECIEELLILLNRLLNQRRVTAEKRFQENLPLMDGDPAMAQLLIFCLINECLGKIGEEGRIILETGYIKGLIRIIIKPEGSLKAGPVDLFCQEAPPEHIALLLGGSITRDNGGVSVLLPLMQDMG
ncbi:MAG: hypothetical protein HY809_08505 [Nitrospirae bacterium]|nr:hypothetical protein [Nitrospirota bacterium]